LPKILILLAGPTASGKSKLALKLAKRIKGEIINADSMQVYKEISVLTSRPSKKDIKQIKHHLYGFISVKKHFSAGQWLKLVKKKIKQIYLKKKIPIIVGGSGLYFNTITKGISAIPPIKKKDRNDTIKIYKQLGQKRFYSKLIQLDPLVKNKILLTDQQRVIRAYEVIRFTKKSIYEWAKKTKSEFTNYDIKKIFLNTPRDILLKNIEKRTDDMINKQTIREVKYFQKLKIKKSLSANKIIGLNEINKFIHQKETLNNTKLHINIKTRQYAKRQMTWSRGHMANWNMLYNRDLSILLKKVLKVIS
tara:strand:+ start:773 stop:1690 length:918 start_codon:yes stop_codon:yes gene_type:complete